MKNVLKLIVRGVELSLLVKIQGKVNDFTIKINLNDVFELYCD